MSACGAEFTWPDGSAFVCGLAVHSRVDHVALIEGVGYEYEGAEGVVTARVTWPIVRNRTETPTTAPWSDRGAQSGPVGHRDRQGRCEALDESEGEA